MNFRSAPVFLPEAFRQSHNRWLGEASEVLRPFLAAVGKLAAIGEVTTPRSWRRGLIIGHNHIGDVLYRTGSLPELSQGLPQCEWTYLTAPESAKLLENNPYIEDVLGLQSGENAWSISADAFAALREKKFDVALCSNSLRYYPDLLLATTLGIPNRVSFVHKGMSGLVTHPVPIEFPSPYAAYFRSIVASVTNAEGDWPVRPQVFPDDGAIEKASALRRQVSAEMPVIACVLTTRQKHGNWPSQFLIDVLAKARENRNFAVAFCGGAGDAEVLNALTAGYRGEKCILAGKLDVLEFAAFLERCTALLTLDSGPRHLGNAARIPVMFARNMSHSQVEAGAYCDSEIDIAPNGEYLTDEDIRSVAAATPPQSAANALIEILSRESRA